MVDVTLKDDAFEAASRRGEAERAVWPLPVSARYDRASGRVVVEFVNGAAFMVPARQLQGLEEATDDELAEVSLLGETGLRWERRDVDFRIAGLMAGIFGSARFMAAASRGGASRSEAKIAAARRNGRKGGRPPRSAGSRPA